MTPMEVAAANVERQKTLNPRRHERRFEIQIWRGLDRTNYYFPTVDLVKIALKSLADPTKPDRPDEVIVSDGCDTCIRVLWLQKSWCGYTTRFCGGVMKGA